MPLIVAPLAQEILGPLVGLTVGENRLRRPVMLLGPPDSAAGAAWLPSSLHDTNQRQINAMVLERLLIDPDAAAFARRPPFAPQAPPAEMLRITRAHAAGNLLAGVASTTRAMSGFKHGGSAQRLERQFRLTKTLCGTDKV
jgi:hypothetical protein